MKNFTLTKKFFLFERDPLTKALKQLAVATEKTTKREFSEFQLENGEVLCCCPWRGSRFSSCWYKDAPQTIIEGDFSFQARYALIHNKTKKWVWRTTGVKALEFEHCVVFSDKNDNHTLCLPHGDEMVIVENVNNYFSNNHMVVYEVEGYTHFTAYVFEDEKFYHLGVKTANDRIFHNEHLKTFFFAREDGLGIVPYISYAKHFCYHIIETEPGSFTIVEVKSGIELTQEYFMFQRKHQVPKNQIQVEVLQFFEGRYKAVTIEHNVSASFTNAYYRKNDNMVELYTYHNGIPVMLESGEVKIPEMSSPHFKNGGKWVFDCNTGVLYLVSPKHKKWWHFWK